MVVDMMPYFFRLSDLKIISVFRMTLEPDGTATAWGTAAKSGGLQFQAGSTPAGVLMWFANVALPTLLKRVDPLARGR